MKKVFLAFAVVAALAACNNEADSSKVVTKDSTTVKIDSTVVKTPDTTVIKVDTGVKKMAADTSKKGKM
ncbi:MAG: hypothetical protein ABJA78_08805 [Ferruginibacter sp.]